MTEEITRKTEINGSQVQPYLPYVDISSKFRAIENEIIYQEHERNVF